jgi:S-adenosylmethionine:tRNA ribosyltransferase-isomerase
MKTNEFDYTLPPDRIAQAPLPQRDQARMMVVHRATGDLEHRRVCDLPDYLHAPDLLILNDTRVIPARLLGRKPVTGGQVELLLLEERDDRTWDVLLRASRRPKPGARLQFGELGATLLEDGEAGRAVVRFDGEGPLLQQLDDIGQPPLPPYIHRGADTAAEDRERYQTIYARAPGSVAAPTAGLHFTEALFARLDAAGVRRAHVTLHVGIGTFRPVTADEVEQHTMESERYNLPPETAAAYEAARAAGGRIIAVGSTSVRTLETVATEHGHIVPASGRSSLYIHPPYTYRVIDAMLTNFHLPQSTLLMMVCALGGYDLMMRAYRVAVEENYRFYSYGDCMLIL